MRRVLALALLALVLSGCSAGTSDDPAPPNADPNGQPTLPPAGPSSSTTGPPTSLGSNSTSASSSSGPTTTATPPPPAGPASFGEHAGEDTASDADFPGLFVGGQLDGSGPQVRIEAAANNAGQRDYRVPDGNCKQPWSEVLRNEDGQVVAHRQPLSACTAFGLKPFPASEFLSTALTWNGTLWDGGKGAFVTAPAGSYTWEVTFDVYSGGSGASYDDHAALTLSFDVEVE